MAGADLTGGAVETADVQALLRTAYGRLTEACFVLLRVADAAAAREWLGAAPVTAAADLARHVPAATHVALSARGLRALGMADQVLAGFALEFLEGMAGNAARARRLGDVGPSDPALWSWGNPAPDLLVLLYAEAGGLARHRAALATPAWRSGFEVLQVLATTDMGGVEPFGFVDGVSQPQVDWAGGRRVGTDADLAYGNLISPGEFMLGYGNEYGLVTERPLLDASGDPGRVLPDAADAPGKRDLGRNGSYLVFRHLAQDVRGFWRFADREGGAARVQLAEAMVGRRLGGAPLVGSEGGPNAFTYAGDPAGLRCPFGAHIRRANPRTGDMPGGRQGALSRLVRSFGFAGGGFRDDLVAASRFHRLLRRGREYGVRITPEQALQAGAPEAESGLHFICLNANITRQFEFIQNAWLMGSAFDGLSGETDPVIGNRHLRPGLPATDGFTLPQPDGVGRRIDGVPPFVTMRGGGYFFLPGLRALRYIAGPRQYC